MITTQQGSQPQQPDLMLLEAWRSGDAVAGARLFERHYDSVARFFSNKIREDHEDLIQATFLGCLEAIEDFRGDASFRTLLFVIARNQLFRYLRRRGRDTKYLSRAGKLFAHSSPPSHTSLLAARNQQQLLLLALRTLPVDTQLMLELHYWEGLAVKEIAAVFGLGINTIKTRMRRGRIQLGKELDRLAAQDAGPLTTGLETLRNGFERWAREIKRARAYTPGESQG